MLFVTVGTDLGFDRFIETIDLWANHNSRNDVFAQIGHSKYEPEKIKFTRFLNSNEFQFNIDQCSAIISHAGMGTVITALSNNKPIVVFPRSPKRGETPNGHQLDTAVKLQELRLAEVAFNRSELQSALSRLETLEPAKGIGKYATGKLIHSIRRRISSFNAEDRITI